MKKQLLTVLLFSIFSIPHSHGSGRNMNVKQPEKGIDYYENTFEIKMPGKLLFAISTCLMLFIILNLSARNNPILESEKQNEKQKDEKRLARTECYGAQSHMVNDHLYATSKLTENSKKELLQRIHRIMENPDEFCNCRFTLGRLSMLVNSNSSYVSQVINETYHKNFRAFINEYRIREAQLRLMDTGQYENYTIQAIAESVGYKSHTNFILIFKRMTGMNPSDFQKIAKGNEPRRF